MTRSVFNREDIARQRSGRSETALPLRCCSAIFQATYCAVVVVESASDDDFVKEDAMILAALFAVIAIVMLCSLLITLTIYALPLYVGLTVGIWVHSSGAGMHQARVAAAIMPPESPRS